STPVIGIILGHGSDDQHVEKHDRKFHSRMVCLRRKNHRTSEKVSEPVDIVLPYVILIFGGLHKIREHDSIDDIPISSRIHRLCWHFCACLFYSFVLVEEHPQSV